MLHSAASSPTPEPSRCESAGLKMFPGAGAGELFQVLRDGTPRTKSQIATSSGLARRTVALRLEALTAIGLVRQSGGAASSGGRPPSSFVFDSGNRLVLAAEIGAEQAEAAITDLTGNIIAFTTTAIDGMDPAGIVDRVVDSGKALIAGLGRNENDLIGVGVGLSDPIEIRDVASVGPATAPKWRGFDVPEAIRARLRLPVLVDSTINMMTLGEWRANWNGANHFLFVNLSNQIGMGIISNRQVQRTSPGAMADLAHVRVPDASLTCRCGNSGCLDAVAAGSDLVTKLRPPGIEAVDGLGVADLAANGVEETSQALRQAGRDLGEVLAVCVSMLNPSLIVIGGDLSGAPEVIAGAREAIYRRAPAYSTGQLRVEPSHSGRKAGILGASSVVVEHVLSPAAINMALRQT